MALTAATEFYSAETPVSRENYDELLKGWVEKNLLNNVPFGAIGKKYCLGENARNNTLIAAKNWTVTDGGKDCTGIDVTPPVITFVTDIPDAVETEHTINITIVDADNNGVPTTYKYGFSDTNTCDSSVNYTEALTSGQNITLNDASKNGKYICVMASDSNGNTAYQASAHPINLDQTPPVITITDNIAAGFAQSETIQATVADNTTHPAPSISHLFTTHPVCDDSLPASSFTHAGGNITLNDETQNGKYVCFRAVDAAGNVSYALTDHPIQVDITPPQIQAATVDISAGVNNPKVTLAGTDTDGSGIQEWILEMDGGAPIVLPATTTEYDFSGLTGTSHTLKITLKDKAGNTSTRTILFPPVVTITAPITTSSGAIAGATVTIDGPAGMQIVDIASSGAGNPTITCTPAPTPLSPRTVPFTCDVADVPASGTLEITATSQDGFIGK